MKKFVGAILVLIVSAAAYAGGGSDKREETVYREIREVIDVHGEGWIDIATAAGEVEVRGWDRAEVEVTGRIAQDVESVSLRHDNESGATTVQVVLPDEKNLSNVNIDSFLTILVPRDADVYITGLGTAVDIRDVDGAIEAQTATGSITVAGPVASVVAETLAGDIDIAGPVELVQFGTANGNATIRGLEGSVYGSTMAGLITIAESVITEAVLTALTGNILIASDVAPDARVQATAQLGGMIEVTLPDTVEGLFTLDGPWDGGLVMDDFSPAQPVEWIFGSPDEEPRAGRATLSGRSAVTSLGRIFGEDSRVGLSVMQSGEDRDDPSVIGISIDLPRLAGIGAASREFRVGSGNARFVLEVNGMMRTGGDDEGDDSDRSASDPRIVLRTTD